MCGFFGLLSDCKITINEKELISSIDLLSHRGSDGQGSYREDLVYLAHKRLAIFDTSDIGVQPLHFKHCTIVFNGAIYNFIELREDLIKRGYTFNTQTDTEVIIASYIEYGQDCVLKFNGQWAFAIYDKLKYEVFCSRDRFGIKPFYYTLQNNMFCFASEQKAIRSQNSFSFRINEEQVNNFLAYGMHDYNEETFYVEIKSLRKGCNMLISLDNLRIKEIPYYSIEDVVNTDIEINQAIKQFKDLFRDSVYLRMRSDVSIGSALSGGLDSSSIVLQSVSNTKAALEKSFSIVYDQGDISEKMYLDTVVEKSQIKNQILTPSFNELNDMIDEVLFHQDEPFDGYGVLAQAYLFKIASQQNIKVMLDGQGADEILAGYEKFYLFYLKNLIKRNPVKGIIELFRFKKRFPQFEFFKRLSIYVDRAKLKYPEWLINTNDSRVLTAEHSSIIQISKDLLSNLGISALLRYEDRNAMAYGIESRVPFLDHRLVELCLSFPDELKIKNSSTKWVLRETMKDLLPKNLYERKNKLGFATPHQEWLIVNQQYFLKEIQLDQKYLSRFIDFNKIVLEGQVLWRVFILGRWMRQQEKGQFVNLS